MMWASPMPPEEHRPQLREYGWSYGQQPSGMMSSDPPTPPRPTRQLRCDNFPQPRRREHAAEVEQTCAELQPVCRHPRSDGGCGPLATGTGTTYESLDRYKGAEQSETYPTRGASVASTGSSFGRHKYLTPSQAQSEMYSTNGWAAAIPLASVASASAGVASLVNAAVPTQFAPAVKLCCDKCDGAHETDKCPHFKQSREEHQDAWAQYSGNGGSTGSSRGRQSTAARMMPHESYRVRRMPGDGSCLFHSIAFGLSGLGYKGEDGHAVRQRVAKFIAENPEFEITGTTLREWVLWDSNTSLDTYARQLSRGGFWGGAIEMAACAQVYMVDIVVYEEDYYGRGAQRISDFLVDSEASNPPRGTVFVMYSGRSHYDAMQAVSRSGRASSTYAGRGHQLADENDDWGSSCSCM